MPDLYYRTMALYGKAESTYNTAPSPDVDGSDAILTSNIRFTPIESAPVSRDTNQPHFGSRQMLYPGIATRVQFEVEFVGGGTAGAAPAWGHAEPFSVAVDCNRKGRNEARAAPPYFLPLILFLLLY